MAKKIEVLMFGHVAKQIEPALKGLKTFEESHGRVSFVCTQERFEKIYTEVRLFFNPFAAMSWNEF
jgi:hypothetical protein